MFKTFYHGTIRRLVIGFGTLFNDIHIQRKDSDGNVVLDYKVPFAYGPKEKFIARLNQGGSISTETDVQITLPRIGFEMAAMTYDSTRKLNLLNKHQKVTSGDSSRVDWQFQGVPYNIEFNLSVMVKNVDDGLQIIEQILPYFSPDFNITLKDNPDLTFSTDVPISLISINSEDEYEGDFDTRRVLTWTLSFLARATIYPSTSDRGIIRKVTVQSYPQVDNVTPEHRETTKPSKELIRIIVVPNPTTADADDDFTFTTTQTDLEV